MMTKIRIKIRTLRLRTMTNVFKTFNQPEESPTENQNENNYGRKITPKKLPTRALQELKEQILQIQGIRQNLRKESILLCLMTYSSDYKPISSN